VTSDQPVVLEVAGDQDAEQIGALISGAFWDLEASTWIIGDPEAAQRIFPGYFTLVVAGLMSGGGVVEWTAGRDAVAVWLPTAADEPEPDLAEWDLMLDKVAGPYAARFRVFEGLQRAHHPHGVDHHYLAMLAVRPDRQGLGLGSALLRAHHAGLDRDGVGAYLEAAGPRQRELYARAGYRDHGGPYGLPDGGPQLYPMWRDPQSS
jgi:GNAT superfamily N-acetyltransferase